MKKINWAYIYQELEFDSEEELEVFISKIKGCYMIEEKKALDGGRVRIVIRKQYNNCNLKVGERNGT